MQILIPIAGSSVFFPKSEYYFPKPLIEIAGKTMIEIVVQHLQQHFQDARFIFVIDPVDARSFSLDRTLRLLTNDKAIILEKPGQTSGALSSSLLAIDFLESDQPLIIANSDQIIECDLAKCVRVLKAADCSAGVISFDSIHPRWSYVVDDENGNIVQTFEKKVASKNAIAGFYYYKSAAIFCQAAKQVILDDAHVDGTFFISSSLNEIILQGGLVRHVPVAAHKYHSFYAPSKLAEFERCSYAMQIRQSDNQAENVNVIIPAAGEGSRFAKEGWKKPKPFIDVDGQLMVERVIQNVSPEMGSVTVLLREEHLLAQPGDASKLQDSGNTIIKVPRLTEGTASTVLLARHIFDNEQPMIVANSDQLVDFSINDFVNDCRRRTLDGSILVFREPTKNRQWSYVRVDERGYVAEVAEKRPISDIATVGIYLFTKGKDFVKAAIDMIIANDRVNNEFYTCPVYNYMIRHGAKIGIYEVSINAMSGLGTPEDLCRYLEYRNASRSVDAPV